MNSIDREITELEREDLHQARQMTGSQKLRAGADLFEEACRWTLAGIRNRHPGIAHEKAVEMLRAQLAMQERWENGV